MRAEDEIEEKIDELQEERYQAMEIGLHDKMFQIDREISILEYMLGEDYPE